jgi:ribosomal-protein-alanine N-acetyltransferase
MKFELPGALESERTIVRIVERSDCQAIFHVHSNNEVTRFLPYTTWKDMSEADSWYERANANHAAETAMQFVIIEKQSRTVIGTCVLFRFEVASGRAEIGYSLGRDYWGSGYMRESLSILLDYGFEKLSLRRVEAEVDPRNASSGKLLLRLGFTKEGLLRQRWVMKGETKDTEFYGLLRHEWAGKNFSQ